MCLTWWFWLPYSWELCSIRKYSYVMNYYSTKPTKLMDIRLCIELLHWDFRLRKAAENLSDNWFFELHSWMSLTGCRRFIYGKSRMPYLSWVFRIGLEKRVVSEEKFISGKRSFDVKITNSYECLIKVF